MRVARLKYFRYIITLLALLQMLLSLLFYQFGRLFFYLDERAEVVPVRSLVSQGGGEDFLIFIGFFLFLILSVFNLIRFKFKVVGIDFFALFIVLSIQLVSLVMIEVASFSLSFDQANGWILKAWFIVYVSLWLTLIIYFFNSKRSSTT